MLQIAAATYPLTKQALQRNEIILGGGKLSKN